MSCPSLAVYFFGYRLDAILYPFREAIASASDLADAVFFAACDNETFDEAKKLQAHNPKLKISRDDWTGDYRVQAYIANRLLDDIGTQYDFALKLDADEVLFETSFDVFRKDLEVMRDQGILLGRPHYTHFLDEGLCTQFIYRSKAVLSRTSSGLRFSTDKGGDACALGGAQECQTGLEIAHYGKWAVGREREALVKEYDFQQKYTELGFPDPIVVKQYKERGYIDYHEIFHVAKSKGEFYLYDGTHPKYVKEWIETMKVRSASFWRDLEGGVATI